MAAMTMGPEPDVGRYIDTYKFDQQMEDRRQAFGGGTSLPLHSDGYEDKQKKLRDERRVEMMQQQEKNHSYTPSRDPYHQFHAKVTTGPQHTNSYDEEIHKMTDRYHKKYDEVLYNAEREPRIIQNALMEQQHKDSAYYRVGTPEQGLSGLGSYEQQRQEHNKQRQMEYNQMMKKRPGTSIRGNKQRQLEKQKLEARQRSPPRPVQPAGPQVDYQANQQQARADDRRAYQDYMGKYQHPNAVVSKPPINYEENRRVLNEERKRDYNQLMEKKAKEERYWAARGRPVTPAGGLDIGHYDRTLKETAQQKKDDYRQDLLRQKAEQLRFRAFEHAAELSPRHTHYRENERPLVGSPRDVNFFMREKEEKDIFRKKNMEKKTDREPSPYKHQYTASIEDPKLKSYYEVEQEKAEAKRKYREELLQQQKEHMFLRARQENEIPVIDRTAQQAPNLASKPPPAPGHRPRDDPTRQTPIFWNEGQRARSPLSLDSEASRRSRPVGNSNIPLAFQTDSSSHRGIPERPVHGQPPHLGEGQRQNDVNKLFPLENSRHSPPPRSPPQQERGRRSPVEENTGRYSPSRPGRDEYMRPPVIDKPSNQRPFEMGQQQQQSLSVGNSGIERQRKEGGQQRQKEYNEYLIKKNEKDQKHRDDMHQMAMGRPAEVVKNQYYSSDNYESYQKDLQRKQSEEYRDFLQKKFQPPAGRTGLPIGQYRYEPKRLAMEEERNKEYNDLIKKFQPNPGSTGLPIGQYVYEPNRLVMEAERNKEYNELLKKGSPRFKNKQLEGPQGLNIDVNFPHRKKAWLEKQRNEEYNKFLEEPKDHGPMTPTKYEPRGDFPEQHPGDSSEAPVQSRPPTAPRRFAQTPPSHTRRNSPPRNDQQAQPSPARQGAPARNYHQAPPSPARQASPSRRFAQASPSMMRPQEKMEGQMKGDQQQPYHQYEPESHYGRFEGHGPYSERKHEHEQLVPGNITRRDEFIPSTPNKLSLPLGHYDKMRPLFEQERNKEYNALKDQFTARKGRISSPASHGMSLPLGRSEYVRPLIERQRNTEYNHLLQTGELDKKLSPRHKASTPPDQQGLPIGQQNYAPMYRAMEYQRNKEYNDFLQKKYNHKLRATQSEPDQDRTSFYLGNEMTHEEKRRLLERERHREYNEMLQKQPPPTNREMPIPSDVESGLSIGQHHHEVWKKFLRDQRNQEYNKLVETKNQQVSNRGWDHNQSGILELRGDDATRNHQQELRSQLRNDYNSFINKIKPAPNHKWPEPDGRGALLVKKGEYDSIRQMYDQQRKNEFREMIGRSREEGDGQIRKRDMPQRAQSEPAPKQHKHINPIVQSMGRYEEIRNQLKEVRKDEFRKFQEQHKGEASRHPESQLTLPRIARDETPIVYKMSNYEENTGKLMLAQRRKDFQEFKQEKLKHLTPRSTTVKENVMPHVASSETPLVNHMGHYDEERRRYQLQRSKDQREYVAKKKEEHHSPYEHYVFPTVAIAEKPVVENMGSDVAQRQLHLREERKRDYERYQLQQRMSEPPRRHDYVDSSNGPYSGLFAGLGDHGNSKEVLKSQRKQEYNDHMEKSKNRPTGRFNRPQDTKPSFSDRGRSPMRNAGPPDQYSHGQADHYQQMLDEKRREEAHRRRYDDPEIQDRFAQNSRDQQRYNY